MTQEVSVTLAPLSGWVIHTLSVPVDGGGGPGGGAPPLTVVTVRLVEPVRPPASLAEIVSIRLPSATTRVSIGNEIGPALTCRSDDAVRRGVPALCIATH